MAQLTTFQQGEILIRENEISRTMFVLKKGRVRVFKEGKQNDITIAHLNEGEIFGEMSFFDAQPRSASVEASTPVEVFVIGTDDVGNQVDKLPDWAKPIMKTVLARLRVADARNVILQSVNDFEKRHFKRDSVAQYIYKWLYRTNKVLMALSSHLGRNGQPIPLDQMREELTELVADQSVDSSIYWRMLKDGDFIDRAAADEQGTFVLRALGLQVWNKELKAEIDAEAYLYLSHSAFAILKKLADVCRSESEDAKQEKATQTLTYRDLDLENMPLLEEALEELKNAKLIERQLSALVITEPGLIARTYQYQSFLKRFDIPIE